MKRGFFIAFEGIDGCGKGAQIRLLRNWFRKKGYKVKIGKNPSLSITGNILRIALKSDKRVTKEADALLFAADRIQNVKDVIEPALKSGAIVLSDRYIFSSLTYQTASGVDERWIKTLNKFAPKPDLTIYLDVPPDVGLKRRYEDSFFQLTMIEKFENLKFLRKVREKYLKLSKEEENVMVIDGLKTEKEIHEEILTRVKEMLK